VNEVRVRLRIGSLDLDQPDDLPTSLPAGQARRLLADRKPSSPGGSKPGACPPG